MENQSASRGYSNAYIYQDSKIEINGRVKGGCALNPVSFNSFTRHHSFLEFSGLPYPPGVVGHSMMQGASH